MRLTKAQKERDALLLARFRVYREWCLPREVRQCIEIRTRTANQQLYEDCKHLAQTSRGRKRDLGRALERVGCAERHAHALCQSFIRGSAHVSWTARGVAHEMARQKYLLEHSGAFKREIGAMAAKIDKRLHELVMARGRVESVRDDSIVYERIRSEATRDVTGAETFAAAAASVARHWPVGSFPSIWPWPTAPPPAPLTKGEKAVLFLKKLKCHGAREHDKFVNIMNMHKYNFLSVRDVDREVAALLPRHPLLREFRETFLRPASA